MRILVDFVRAEQHWSPDTGAQENFLIFGFGGRVHRIPCSEQDIIEAVREARTGVSEDYRAAEDPENREQEDEGQGPQEAATEFLSPDETVTVNPPVMFHSAEPPPPAPTQNAELIRKNMIADGMEHRPRSRDKLKREKLERMRTVARTAPHNKGVGQDDVGNPLVSGGDRPPGNAVAADAPTVVRRPVTGGGDDDPFRQG